MDGGEKGECVVKVGLKEKEGEGERGFMIVMVVMVVMMVGKAALDI